MVSIKFLFFVALAIACVLAFPEEAQRVKKQVYYGSYGYPYAAYTGHSGYAAPLAYSAYGYPYVY